MLSDAVEGFCTICSICTKMIPEGQERQMEKKSFSVTWLRPKKKTIQTSSEAVLSQIPHMTWDCLCQMCSHLLEILYLVWVDCPGGWGRGLINNDDVTLPWYKYYMLLDKSAISVKEWRAKKSLKQQYCNISNTPTCSLWSIQTMTRSVEHAQAEVVLIELCTREMAGLSTGQVIWKFASTHPASQDNVWTISR